ncbi:unnamed protein product [Sphacelaria rigidula]
MRQTRTSSRRRQTPIRSSCGRHPWRELFGPGRRRWKQRRSTYSGCLESLRTAARIRHRQPLVAVPYRRASRRPTQGWNDDEWGHFVFINSPCEEKSGADKVSLPPPSASPAAGRGLVDKRLLSPLPSPLHRQGVKKQQDSRRAEVCLKTALGNPPATTQPVTNIMSRNTITVDFTPPKSGGESYKP